MRNGWHRRFASCSPPPLHRTGPVQVPRGCWRGFPSRDEGRSHASCPGPLAQPPAHLRRSLQRGCRCSRSRFEAPLRRYAGCRCARPLSRTTRPPRRYGNTASAGPRAVGGIPSEMMNTPVRLRERAAECRALARGRITRNDAAEWLRLADKWDAFADRIEASVARDALEYPPPRRAQEQGHGRGGA